MNILLVMLLYFSILYIWLPCVSPASPQAEIHPQCLSLPGSSAYLLPSYWLFSFLLSQSQRHVITQYKQYPTISLCGPCININATENFWKLLGQAFHLNNILVCVCTERWTSSMFVHHFTIFLGQCLSLDLSSWVGGVPTSGVVGLYQSSWRLLWALWCELRS